MTIYSRLCRGGVLSLLGSLLFVFPLAANAETQHGKVRAAGKPISGATVKLFRAGTSFDASAELLGSAKTNPGGVFEIKYKQPRDVDAVLYLISDGGSVIRGNRRRPDINDKLAKLLEDIDADTDIENIDLALFKVILAGFLADQRNHKHRPNSAIKLAAVLGSRDIPNEVTINERTTVATAYTMAQFLDEDDISGPAPGVPNAADIFRNLVELKNGKIGRVLATSPNGNETDTLQAFNSLANMLVVCVNKKSRCKKLFKYTTPPSGETEPTPPTDTLQALRNIVHYPYQNLRKLYRYSKKKKQKTIQANIRQSTGCLDACAALRRQRQGDGRPGFHCFR